MNHKVNNVQQLYVDGMDLYKNVVLENADSIIDNLSQSISILKSSWEGKDAEVQINNVVEVYNGMVLIRNILVELAKEAVSAAADYRNIQIANRTNFDELSLLQTTLKNSMERHVDNRDTINITSDAARGQSILDTARASIDQFLNQVKLSHAKIMDNWQAGGKKRDDLERDFADFINKSSGFGTLLDTVSRSITDALRNYMI